MANESRDKAHLCYALEHVGRFLAATPQDIDAICLKTELLLSLKQVSAGMGFLQMVLEADPRHPRAIDVARSWGISLAARE